MVRIGVTLGDPSGIGPEIVAKAMASGKINPGEVILFGNKRNFYRIVSENQLDSKVPDDVGFHDVKGEEITTGQVSGLSGRIASESIEAAVKSALDHEVDGICTAPINKESILLSGSTYKDHTDMLSGLTGSREVVTIFEVETLRIIFLSKHVSLRDACNLVKKENIYRYIELADRSLRLLDSGKRRIAVAALNPHAGENGLFGDEETNEIIPAIKKAREKYDVSGPLAADSVFHQASRGKYDIVLSMYHDQGHIAAKMLNFGKTVSMNIGLPFLRTSVDHGTAFDIAGRGVADETSMIEAMLKCLHHAGRYREILDSGL